MAALFAVASSASSSRRSRRGPSSRNRRAELARQPPRRGAGHLGDRAPPDRAGQRARDQRGDPGRQSRQSGRAAVPPGRPSAADRLRSLDCLTAAIYYEAASEPTDGQRAVAQVVLNRVRHPAYPNTRLRRRLRRRAARSPAASSASPATVRCGAAPMADYWERARRSPRPRSTAMSMRRSAGRPIITPIMSCLTGPRAWSNRPPSACTSSIAGAAAGAGRRPSSTAMPAPSRRSPGAAASASRSRSELRGRSERARRGAAAAAAAAEAPIGSVDSFQRAVLRRYEPLQPRHRQCDDRRAYARRPRLTNSQRWALTGSDSGAAAQAPLGRRQEARAAARAAGRALPLGSGAAGAGNDGEQQCRDGGRRSSDGTSAPARPANPAFQRSRNLVS